MRARHLVDFGWQGCLCVVRIVEMQLISVLVQGGWLGAGTQASVGRASGGRHTRCAHHPSRRASVGALVMPGLEPLVKAEG